MAVTIRRNLEQAKHCIEEALSAWMHDLILDRTNSIDVLDDLDHAQALITDVKRRIVEGKQV